MLDRIDASLKTSWVIEIRLTPMKNQLQTISQILKWTKSSNGHEKLLQLELNSGSLLYLRGLPMLQLLNRLWQYN